MMELDISKPSITFSMINTSCANPPFTPVNWNIIPCTTLLFYKKHLKMKKYLLFFLIVIFSVTGYAMVGNPITGDAYIWESNPDDNYGSSTSLYTGIFSGGHKQSLIQFDLNSIPACSQITSATFHIYRRSGGAYSEAVEIYRVTAPWDENTVTWNSFNKYNKFGTGMGKWYLR